MNTKEMHGKEIESIWWPDTENSKGTVIMASGCLRLYMSATHHGDHDQFWIVEEHWHDDLSPEGGRWVEWARHNVRFVDGFRWK